LNPSSVIGILFMPQVRFPEMIETANATSSWPIRPGWRRMDAQK
jgi:hypothetical protein